MNYNLDTNAFQIKERKTVINIDSRDRSLTPKNIYQGSYIRLPSNAIALSNNSNIVTIVHPSHNYRINDKITLLNVQGQVNVLTQKTLLKFKSGSPYVKVYHPNHNMSHLLPFNRLEPSTDDIYYVEFSNIINNTETNKNYFNNIHIDLLNRKHRVILNYIDEDHSPNDFDGNDLKNYYHIELPIYFTKNVTNQNDKYYYWLNGSMKVIQLHLYGIPIEYLNADYPLNKDKRNGFHIVTRIIDNNHYQITVSKPAYTNIIESVMCGGQSLITAHVRTYLEGYPDQNYYKILLKRTFYNVAEIKLISTEFPNTAKVIRDYPTEKSNNHLYWKNIDDGDYFYTVSISGGNYDSNQLKTELETKFNQVKRITDYTRNFNPSILLRQGGAYLTNPEMTIETILVGFNPLHVFTIDLNIYNNQVTITSNKEIFLKSCIYLIDPLANKSNDDPTYIKEQEQNPQPEWVKRILSLKQQFLRVYHPYHNLEKDDTVTISYADDIASIPSTAINVTHKVFDVCDEHSYILQLPSYKPLLTNENNFGGSYISIRFPDYVKFLFNYSNTLGSLLGFRNVGNNKSITPFSKKITNTGLYEFELSTDSIGNSIPGRANNINLSGDNYILMANDILDTLYNTGTTKNIFAKILLSGAPGNVLFNTFVSTPKVFETPISTLSELEFYFYYPDGMLYDFNGSEHSFSLEITEKIPIPVKTNINSRTQIPSLLKSFHSN